MPEWALIVVALAFLCALGPLWPPLLRFAFPLAGALLLPLANAVLRAVRAPLHAAGPSRIARARSRALLAFLHLLQPLARLRGRL